MKMKRVILMLGIAMSLLSCNKDEVIKLKKNDAGEIVSMPYDWKNNNGFSDKFLDNHIRDKAIAYQGNVITNVAHEDGFKVKSIDAETGNTVWQNSEYYFYEEPFKNSKASYVYNNYLVIPYLNILYTYDLNNGDELISKEFLSLNNNKIDGISNNLYVTDWNCDDRIFQYDIMSSNETNLHEFVEVFDTMSSAYPIMHRVCELNNKPYVIQTYSKSYNSNSGRINNVYIRLFDITDTKWIYDKQIGVGYISEYVYVYNNLLFICVYPTSVSYCIDIEKGEMLWNDDSNYLGEEALFDDSIIISSTSSNGINARNVETGTIVWQIKDIHGSYIQKLGNYLYCIANNKLMCIEFGTGKILWRISAPENDLFYKVTVVPGEKQGEGKIVAQTLNAMYSYTEYLNGDK